MAGRGGWGFHLEVPQLLIAQTGLVEEEGDGEAGDGIHRKRGGEVLPRDKGRVADVGGEGLVGAATARNCEDVHRTRAAVLKRYERKGS